MESHRNHHRLQPDLGCIDCRSPLVAAVALRMDFDSSQVVERMGFHLLDHNAHLTRMDLSGHSRRRRCCSLLRIAIAQAPVSFNAFIWYRSLRSSLLAN